MEETNLIQDTDMSLARGTTRLRPFGSAVRKAPITGRHSSVLETLAKNSAVSQNKVKSKITKQRTTLEAAAGSDESGTDEPLLQEDPYGAQLSQGHQSQEPLTPLDPTQQFDLTPRTLEPALASAVSPLER